MKSWERDGGSVIGLTVAQTAATTLADEAGVRAENITRWLTTGEQRPHDPNWHFQAGDLVLVDEVGMVPTPQLDRLRAQAEAAGAKILGIGDPLQLGPIGAGGAARLIATDIGATHLQQVHRFQPRWEAEASLRLRDGDPSVADTYATHGRVHSGDQETVNQLAREAWLADHLDGKTSLLLAASVNDVADLAAWCRDQLVQQGEVKDERTVDLRDGNHAGPGDLVVTRRNDRRLGVANRDVWRLEKLTRRGDAAVRHLDRGTSTILPTDYLAGHVELAYASTVHAAQGRTVDTSHLVATMGVDRELAYVGLTRGREANHIYVVADDYLHEEFGGGHMAGRDAFRAIVDQAPATLSATETLRAELDSVDSAATWGPILDDVQDTITRRRASSLIAHHHNPTTAAAVDNDPSCGQLVARLRHANAAGINPDRILTLASRSSLTGATNPAKLITARIDNVLEQLNNNTFDPTTLPLPDRAWTPPVGPIEKTADDIADLLDRRARTLGEHAALDQPSWATNHWGAVPADPVGQARWTHSAGVVALYREQWGETAPISQVTEQPPDHPGQLEHWRALRKQLDRSVADDAMPMPTDSLASILTSLQGIDRRSAEQTTTPEATGLQHGQRTELDL